jgi:uncharacterized RDD family membrane protein YckC
MDWYYAMGQTRFGPVPEQDLRDLVASGRLGPDTLVWCAGFEAWQALAAVPGLAELLPSGPGSPAPADAFAEAPGGEAGTVPEERWRAQARPDEDTDPHPWLRWIARGFDSWIFSLSIGFVGVGALALTVPAAAAWLETMPLLLWGAVWAVAMVLLEAFVLSVKGTTPGKWLFGMRVALRSGGAPTFPVALRRTVLVWWRGLGLNLPVVSLITMVVAHSTLTREGETSWDRDTGLVVSHRRMSIGRALLAVVTGALLFAVALGLTLLGEGPA